MTYSTFTSFSLSLFSHFKFTFQINPNWTGKSRRLGYRMDYKYLKKLQRTQIILLLVRRDSTWNHFDSSLCLMKCHLLGKTEEKNIADLSCRFTGKPLVYASSTWRLKTNTLSFQNSIKSKTYHIKRGLQPARLPDAGKQERSGPGAASCVYTHTWLPCLPGSQHVDYCDTVLVWVICYRHKQNSDWHG